MNKTYNRCLFTHLPAHPAMGWIVGNSPRSRANNIYSRSNDMLTGQLHVNQVAGLSEPSLTLKGLFLFSDLAVKTNRQIENKSRKLCL